MKFALLFCYFQILVATCLKSSRLSEFVANQVMNGKTKSGTPVKGIREIYCQKTGRRVQIRDRKVDANGDRGNKFAKMEFKSVNFQGRITIKGVATGRYLCMNKKGRLLAKHRRNDYVGNNCIFTHSIALSSYFDVFSNVRHPRWVIAFNSRGRPRRGPKTSAANNEAHFLVTSPDGASTSVFRSTQPSTSFLNDDQWRKVAKKFLKLGNGMQADDPNVLTPQVLPPDVQEEIEMRRKEMRKWAMSEVSTTAILTSSPTTLIPQIKTRGNNNEKRRKKKNRKNKQKGKKQTEKNTDVSKIKNDVITNSFQSNSMHYENHNNEHSATRSISTTHPQNSSHGRLRKKKSRMRNHGTKLRKFRSQSRHSNKKVT